MEIDPREKYVLCVGMCVLDVIHVVQTFPDEDTDRRSKHGRWQRGGNASNVCTVLRQLNQKCEFLGSVSQSRMFEFIIDDAQNRGIRINHCPFHDQCEPPISSVILTESTGTRTIIHSNPNLPILTFDDFRKICLNQYKWIHFEARNRDETKKMIDLIFLWNKIDNKPNITISIELENLSPNNIALVEHADYVFLSKDYATMMGWTTKEVAIHTLRKYVKDDAKLICAWGIEGAVAIDHASDSFCAAPAYQPEKVVDTLGAGDTFVAATIFALNNEKSLADAIDFGCRVAGAKVGGFGFDHLNEIFVVNNKKF